MSLENYPNLHHAVLIHHEEATESLGAELADVIDQETSTDSLIDGAATAVLEQLAMVAMVNATEALRTGRPGPDQLKVRQGRVKVIEGILEMVEASEASDYFQDDGQINPLDLMREFVAYSHAKEKQDV
jgi:hypothetical protein